MVMVGSFIPEAEKEREIRVETRKSENAKRRKREEKMGKNAERNGENWEIKI